MIETPLVTKDYKLRACGYKLEPAFESLPSLEVRTTAALHLSLRFTESSRLLRVKSRHALEIKLISWNPLVFGLVGNSMEFEYWNTIYRNKSQTMIHENKPIQLSCLYKSYCSWLQDVNVDFLYETKSFGIFEGLKIEGVYRGIFNCKTSTLHTYLQATNQPTTTKVTKKTM